MAAACVSLPDVEAYRDHRRALGLSAVSINQDPAGDASGTGAMPQAQDPTKPPLSLSYREIYDWCGREDLNLHDLAATSS